MKEHIVLIVTTTFADFVFKGEVDSYMKVGALDFYLLFKLDMLVII
jgi:hypothetical protein